MFSSNGTRITYKGGKGSSSGDSATKQKNGLTRKGSMSKKDRQRSTSDKEKKLQGQDHRPMFSNQKPLLHNQRGSGMRKNYNVYNSSAQKVERGPSYQNRPGEYNSFNVAPGSSRGVKNGSIAQGLLRNLNNSNLMKNSVNQQSSSTNIKRAGSKGRLQRVRSAAMRKENASTDPSSSSVV